MASVPPPLPSSRPPPLPIGYRSAKVVASRLVTEQASLGARWVTVASLRTPAQWHAAHLALSRQQIMSRVNPNSPEMDDMEIQVPPTEAEWAREILGQSMPEIVGIAGPPGGFPVVELPAAASVVPTSISVPAAPGSITAMPVGPLRSASQAGVGYYLVLSLLWIVLIAAILLIIVPCVYWYYAS